MNTGEDIEEALLEGGVGENIEGVVQEAPETVFAGEIDDLLDQLRRREVDIGHDGLDEKLDFFELRFLVEALDDGAPEVKEGQKLLPLGPVYLDEEVDRDLESELAHYPVHDEDGAGEDLLNARLVDFKAEEPRALRQRHEKAKQVLQDLFVMVDAARLLENLLEDAEVFIDPGIHLVARDFPQGQLDHLRDISEHQVLRLLLVRAVLEEFQHILENLHKLLELLRVGLGQSHLNDVDDFQVEPLICSEGAQEIQEHRVDVEFKEDSPQELLGFAQHIHEDLNRLAPHIVPLREQVTIQELPQVHRRDDGFHGALLAVVGIENEML